MEKSPWSDRVLSWQQKAHALCARFVAFVAFVETTDVVGPAISSCSYRSGIPLLSQSIARPMSNHAPAQLHM